MTSDPKAYKDPNADKFPEPVEPLGMGRDTISPSTVNIKDPYINLGVGLFITHNLIRRSLRSVATHARTQTPTPSPEFLRYTSFVMKFLHDHHEHEDTIFFPAIQPYVDFSESGHEHEEILQLMATVNDTLKIGGETLAKNTEALLEVLDEHLKKEEWLVNMYARRIPKDLLLDLDKKLENAIKEDNKELGDVWVLGFVSKGLNPDENAVFPPIPGIVKFIFRMIANWKYGKELAYAPYS